MSTLDLFVDYLKYTQEQNKVHESIVKSMADSHKQTCYLLNTYLTNNNDGSHVGSVSEATPTIRESILRTSNNITDSSLNGTATLADISTLIGVLRENINILGRRNLNPNNTTGVGMTPGSFNTENSILQSGIHMDTPVIRFSTANTRGQSIGALFHRITRDNQPAMRPIPPTEEIDYRPRSSAMRHEVPRPRSSTMRYEVPRPPGFVEGDEPLIVPGNLNSPVRVRPSMVQIRNGTQLITFSGDISTNGQTQCPIDLNVFTEGDSILKIIGCGHVFREMNLRNHFRYRATCPLCRYDIRDYNASENQ